MRGDSVGTPAKATQAEESAEALPALSFFLFCFFLGFKLLSAAKKGENGAAGDQSEEEKDVAMQLIAQQSAEKQCGHGKAKPGNFLDFHRTVTVSSSGLRLACIAEGTQSSAA